MSYRLSSRTACQTGTVVVVTGIHTNQFGIVALAISNVVIGECFVA